MQRSMTPNTNVKKSRSRKSKDKAHLIEERLQPITDIYQGEDYSSSNNKIEIKMVVDSAYIEAPKTDSYNTTSIKIGAVSGKAKEYKREALQKAIDDFLDPSRRATHLHILRLSPYWISALAGEEKLVGHRMGSFRNMLILYRLVEICLAAVDALAYKEEEKIDKQLQSPASLLLRQRYLYLVQLPKLAADEDERLRLYDYIPGHSFLVRKAREAYASLLLNEDKALLAFAEVKSRNAPWDLDSEVRILLYTFSRRKGTTQLALSSCLWDFAKEGLPGQILTDTLLRRWFLAHDDLAEASAGVYALLKDGSRKINGLAAWGLKHSHGLNGAGLVLFTAGALVTPYLAIPLNLNLEWLKLVFMGLGIVIGLILPILVVLILSLSKQPLSSRQVFYPLALRVPAMGLVGVLAIAGLMDSLVRYTLNAFNRPWPALTIAIFSVVSAFAYILFEVQTRLTAHKKAVRRAFALWYRGLFSTIWLAIVTGWLADPIGLTACHSEEAVKMECVTTNYGLVIKLERAVDFLGGRISLDYVILVGAIALMAGVFTQIFWEDKAIAEPL